MDSWMCRLFGHMWKVKRVKTSKGIVTEHLREVKACLRCREPNPKYPERKT